MLYCLNHRWLICGQFQGQGVSNALEVTSYKYKKKVCKVWSVKTKAIGIWGNDPDLFGSISPTLTQTSLLIQ